MANEQTATNYDLFITKINEKGTILGYSIYDESYNINIENLTHLKVTENIDYCNYKLINNDLIELTEEEKPNIEPQLTELELLRQEKEILAQSVYELAEIIELFLIGGITE